MDDFIKIQTVEPEGDDGLIVTFTDGTTTAYVTEELLALRPCREPIELYTPKNGPGQTAGHLASKAP